MTRGIALRLAGTAMLTLALAGCAYDYLNHSDRVAFSSGDAVKANLESETVNPANPASDNLSGLGKNGPVNPAQPGS